MKLTKIGLFSDSSIGPAIEVVTFSLEHRDPSSTYMVRGITGLDAEELVPKYYGSGLISKSKFYNFSLKPRDIAMRVVLNPRFYVDEEVSDIRNTLYKAISASRTGNIMLYFYSGASVEARISGFITKFEVGYFNKLPEVQITVRCNDPLFRGVNPVIFAPSELSATTTVDIPDSLSVAPHGFSCELTFTATQPNFVIQDKATSPDWKFIVIPSSGGFLAGDKLYFSSEYQNEDIYMVRGSTTTYLMDKIQPQSLWPILFPGSNQLHFSNRAAFNFNDLRYYAAYWGV